MLHSPTPKCPLTLAKHAVPINFGRRGRTVLTFDDESLSSIARPKSVTYTTFPCLPMPIKQFSGLMSRWMIS